jgi:hypothetical protein
MTPDPSLIPHIKKLVAETGHVLGIPVGKDIACMKISWRRDPLDPNILYPGNHFTLGFAPLGKDTSRLMGTPFTVEEARLMGERWVEWGGEA